MNLQDALKSGKRFKRASASHGWYRVTACGRRVVSDHVSIDREDGASYTWLMVADALADDWVVEERIELSEEQIRDAIGEVSERWYGHEHLPSLFVTAVVGKLGFK